jgi:PAS domain S-box-containing protein
MTMLSAESALGQVINLSQQIGRTFNWVFFLYDALENRVIHVSPNYATLLGHSEEDVYQNPKYFLKAVHPEDRGKVLRWFRKGLAGSMSNSEYRVLLPYGETRWQASCLVPIRDTRGVTVRLVGLVLDITRRMNAEHGLRQSQAQLRQVQKMEALGTLLAGVAHEINNPINTLMFNVPLLNDIWRDVLPVMQIKADQDPEAKIGGIPLGVLANKLAQVLEDTDQAVHRAAKIVQHLQEFARPAPLTHPLETSLNSAVQKALILCSATVRKARVELKTDLADDLPCLLADPTSLEEILINLIMNATEAIDHDHGLIKVKTGLNVSGDIIRLEMADNGRGVPVEIADRLFEPFVTQRPKGNGTGLGLSVTRNLVEECGGVISYESNPDEGTVFKVAFPLISSIRPTQVLVVDDDQTMRQIIQKRLSRQPGISVQVANNGVEAVVKLGRYTPDIIVTDLFMPGMDGRELLRHVKSTPALSQVDLLVITGLPDSPEAQEIRESGLADVVPKPFKSGELINKIVGMIKSRETG